ARPRRRRPRVRAPDHEGPRAVPDRARAPRLVLSAHHDPRPRDTALAARGDARSDRALLDVLPLSCPERGSNPHEAFASEDFTRVRRFPSGADYLFTRVGCRALVGGDYRWGSPR